MRVVSIVVPLVLLVVVVTTILSCSTIVNGSREELSVMTSPDNAKITIDGFPVGAGLATLKVSRGTRHIIEVSKEGFRTVRVKTGNGVAGWYWGNLLGFSIVGMLADIISGAAYSIDPNPVLVKLDSGSGPPIIKEYATSGYIFAGLVFLALTAYYAWIFGFLLA